MFGGYKNSVDGKTCEIGKVCGKHTKYSYIYIMQVCGVIYRYCDSNIFFILFTEVILWMHVCTCNIIYDELKIIQ